MTRVVISLEDAMDIAVWRHALYKTNRFNKARIRYYNVMRKVCDEYGEKAFHSLVSSILTKTYSFVRLDYE